MKNKNSLCQLNALIEINIKIYFFFVPNNQFYNILITIIFFIYLHIVLNVAAGKAPMQISTDAGGIPQKAIDGSTSAFFTPDTCSLTKSERVPWWYVNLLEPYMVQLVRLDFGKSCCGKCKLYLFVPFLICIYIKLFEKGKLKLLYKVKGKSLYLFYDFKIV